MAILIEALNVVVRRALLEQRFPGGTTGFEDIVPNQTFCADDHLVRVGFMDPASVGEFVATLERYGFQLFDGSTFTDVAVVDQLRGLTAPAPWLTMGKAEQGHAFAYMTGTPPGTLQTPESWTLAASLSNEQDIFTPLQDVEEQLEHLDFSDGVHRVRSRSTGQINFIAGEESALGHFLRVKAKVATPRAQARSVRDTTGGMINRRSVHAHLKNSAFRTMEEHLPSDAGLLRAVGTFAGLQPISSQEARQALLSFLRQQYGSLDHLRTALQQGQIHADALPTEVQWGLHYAGLLVHTEPDEPELPARWYSRLLRIFTRSGR
jgi:hypothetical protein